MIWRGDLRPQQRPGIFETWLQALRFMGPVGCGGLVAWVIIGVLLTWGVTSRGG